METLGDDGGEVVTGNARKVVCRRVPARFVVVIMGFFGTFNLYSLSVNLSVGIVAMVDYNTSNPRDNDSVTGQAVKCGELDVVSLNKSNTESGSNINSQRFSWDENTQGLLLGAFFYGHVSSQVIGAWLGRLIGRVRLWGVNMLLASALTILLPFFAQFGPAPIVVFRVIIGALSGVTYPLMQGLLGEWAPPAERSKLVSFYLSGAPFGTFVVLPLGGALAEGLGWESVFYVTGAAGAVWSVLLLAIVYDRPADHPRITPAEKQYIQRSLGQNKTRSRRHVPWRSILTSYRFWCAVIPNVASNFSIFMFLTMMPTYLRTVMNFDIGASGGYSSIPYLAKTLMYISVGFLADWVISKGVKTIHVRKACSTIGLLIPGASMAALAYVGCNVPLIISLLTIPIAIDTFTAPGAKTSMLELAPAFSGVTFAICNTINASSGFVAPQIIGLLRTQYREDPVKAWRFIFWLAATVNFVGAFVFLLFGSSNVQPWAQEKTAEERGQTKELILIKDDNSEIKVSDKTQ